MPTALLTVSVSPVDGTSGATSVTLSSDGAYVWYGGYDWYCPASYEGVLVYCSSNPLALANESDYMLAAGALTTPIVSTGVIDMTSISPVVVTRTQNFKTIVTCTLRGSQQSKS